MNIGKIFSTIIKTALSIAAVRYIHPDGVGSALVAFAAVYAVICWYIRSFTRIEIAPGFEDGGFILNILVNLLAPALMLSIPAFILQAILPGEIGIILYGGGIVLAGVWCLISDIMHMFSPDFRVDG